MPATVREEVEDDGEHEVEVVGEMTWFGRGVSVGARALQWWCSLMEFV